MKWRGRRRRLTGTTCHWSRARWAAAASPSVTCRAADRPSTACCQRSRTDITTPSGSSRSRSRRRGTSGCRDAVAAGADRRTIRRPLSCTPISSRLRGRPCSFVPPSRRLSVKQNVVECLYFTNTLRTRSNDGCLNSYNSNVQRRNSAKRPLLHRRIHLPYNLLFYYCSTSSRNSARGSSSSCSSKRISVASTGCP